MASTPLPIIGLSLGDAALTALLAGTDRSAQVTALDQLDQALRTTAAGVLYLGGDRFRPSAEAYLDPLFAGQRLLGALPEAAVLVSTSPALEHPFNYARRSLTADHYSRGRLGVVVGSFDQRALRRSDGQTPWSHTPLGVQLTGEFARVLRQLWRSWPIESILADRENGIFADPTQIVSIDYEGAYSVGGPLNSPSSRQGEPVLAWHLTSDDENGAVEDAELLIADPDQSEVVNGLQEHRETPLRLVEISSTEEVPEAGVFTGALLRITDLTGLEGIVSFLSSQEAASSSNNVPESREGTLRERLGLAPRRFDTTHFAPAFSRSRYVSAP